MADWREIRAHARDVVHSTFGFEAVYYAPGSSQGLNVTVRHHNATVTTGDLDNEGYAERIEDVNRVVLDTEQVVAVPKGRIVLANGDQLFLEVRERQDDSRYQVWNVLRQRYVAPPPAPAPPPP